VSLFIFIDKDSRGVRTIGVKRFGYISEGLVFLS